MLQNQRNAIQRESQSRQMLTNLGAPPVKKFSDGGPAGSSSGVRRLKMSGYQEGGEVNENPYVRMAREERAAQDKAFDSVNRQLSDLLERYKEGNEGITEKDLLPFFPGYNEYDIAQMYGTTTESSVPSMSSKARSFTPEIMSNLRKHDELMQKDFDRLVKEKRLPRDVITARTLGLANGGEVTNDEFIQEMFTGTRPEDFPETSPVDKKAGELLRALSEGTRGFVGAEPIEPGSEAYRTGQALANMPAVGVVAATAKGAGKAKDALKALTKKDIKLIASELETSRGQLAELVKKYPQLRDASVADIEALTKGEPFTAFRGISLLPGRELRKESTPSMTVDPSVALGMLKDAPVMITKEGFITATPVLRQYPGMKASETQVYVPSLIEQITERQPGALEMKIPTRSGEKMTVADVFKEVKGEKELLADVSKKEPRDILFDRYQGGVGDRYLMEVARRVLAGKWEGGEALLKEIGGYQTDPKGLVQEFDSFAELVKESALKKAKGGEVTNDEFIQEMMTGTRPTDETTSPGILPPEIRQAVDVPLDFANLLIRGTAAVPIGGAAGLYKGLTGGKYGTQEGVKEADTEAARMMAKITGEPKTQAAKDVLEFIGGKAQEYKLDAALPQLLTLPSPGPGAASALMRSYELAETPPSGVVKMPGGNWLKGQVEYFVRPLKKDIPWTQDQLEEMPGVAKAEAPNLALNKFIETGLTRYIKNDMASAKDTLRNLADENTIKAGKAYNNDLRQVKKAYDRAEKIKAEGPRPNMLPGTWENAIEAQLGRARQLEEEANRKLNLELRHALPFPVLQEDGELAGGLNFHMRRNLQTGGKETLVSSRKEAGQAEEGVAQTPTGKVWETMADLFVKPQAAGQITDQDYFMRSTDSQRVLRNNPWLATVPPETPVYIPQDVFRSSSFLNSFSPDDLGFKHITDELANAMNPGSGLPANLLLTPDEVANMGMEKAARHVIEVNKWREEQMGVANALRAQKSISLYKDYPTIPGKTEPNQRGLQWLELKLMPEDDTPESMVKAKEALADALKYEGEVMGHCVGGECPKVESGLSRIISLRDAKGEPHVTLEVAPPSVLKTGNNPEDFLSENPEIASQVPSNQSLSQQMGFYQQLVKTPEFQEWLKSKPSAVLQIKGKGNNRPPDSYQPFITDFIASQQWSSVGDLQNTNLVRIEPMILKNAQDRGFNPQIVTTIKERPYITKEEFNRLADLFGGMNKYAAGGEVTDFIKRAA
jgi:hypothetical protein